jgi:hypothetical protein
VLQIEGAVQRFEPPGIWLDAWWHGGLLARRFGFTLVVFQAPNAAQSDSCDAGWPTPKKINKPQKNKLPVRFLFVVNAAL